VRTPLQSGVRLGSGACILTVRVDDPWTQATIERLGVPLLQVRHPLPACERILVNRPIVVVVGPKIRAQDMQCVARAAAEVHATLVEAAFVGEARLVSVLLRAIEAALAEHVSPLVSTRL
jgi:hypothetical protein